MITQLWVQNAVFLFSVKLRSDKSFKSLMLNNLERLKATATIIGEELEFSIHPFLLSFLSPLFFWGGGCKSYDSDCGVGCWIRSILYFKIWLATLIIMWVTSVVVYRGLLIKHCKQSASSFTVWGLKQKSILGNWVPFAPACVLINDYTHFMLLSILLWNAWHAVY